MYRRAYYRFRRGQRNSSSESSNQHPRWKRYWPVGVVLAVPLIAAAGNYLSNLFNKRSDEPKYEEETVETTPAVVAPPQVSAETEEVPSQESISAEDTCAIVNRTKEILGIPGLVVAVAKDGKLVFERGFGYADVEGLVEMTPDHIMRVASISKTLTTAGLGVLMDKALIDIDAPMQIYTERFPAPLGEQITPRMIAAHTSGIRHYQGLEFYMKDSFPTTDEALKIFIDDPLKKQPGETWLYSTHAYTALAAAIERAGNSSYLDFMQKNVFDKAGMKDIRPDSNDIPAPVRTQYYMRKPVMSAEDEERAQKGEPLPMPQRPEGRLPRGQFVPAPWALRVSPYVDNSWKWAGGGFASTARDIVHFGNAILDNTLFSQAIRDILFTPVVPKDGSKRDYGLGWLVRNEKGHLVVSHSGGAVGASTQLTVFPNDKVVVVILTNLQDVRLYDAARSIGLAWVNKSK